MMPSDGANFSQALDLMKLGEAMARTGWNGKGQFVMAQFPDEHSKMGNPYLYIDARELGGERTPWAPSQTDLFAEDWRVVTNEVQQHERSEG
jgi:hypothetical protein